MSLEWVFVPVLLVLQLLPLLLLLLLLLLLRLLLAPLPLPLPLLWPRQFPQPRSLPLLMPQRLPPTIRTSVELELANVVSLLLLLMQPVTPVVVVGQTEMT
jgi:hypothetical protein